MKKKRLSKKGHKRAKNKNKQYQQVTLSLMLKEKKKKKKSTAIQPLQVYIFAAISATVANFTSGHNCKFYILL